MNNILADFAPDTQRKDKFKLDMRVTQAQARALSTMPFFSLYLNKQGKGVFVWQLLQTIFNGIYPRLASYKINSVANQQKSFQSLSARVASSLLLKKQDDGFLFTFNVPQLTFDTLLDTIYDIPKQDQFVQRGPMGELIDSVYTGFANRIRELYYTESGAENVIPFTNNTLVNYVKTDAEKLAFSCIKQFSISVQNNVVTKLHFEILMSVEEAQMLTRLQYAAIRNIDIYPVLLSWIQLGLQKGPTTSVSLSRISANIDPSSVQYAKINEHGLAINQHGVIYYIPREVNNSRAYESAFADYCTSGDPEDQFFGLAKNQGNKKLPVNMPVLVDWTNAKFTYSSTTGGLVVMDLAQCRPVTATHIRNVFNRTYIDGSYLKTFIVYAQAVDCPVDQGLPNYLDNLLRSYNEPPTLWSLCADELFKPVVDFFTMLASKLEQNAEVFYNAYSVATWCEVLGFVKSIAVYGANWQQTSESDKVIRSAATNQQITPDWSMFSVPFFNNAPGLMPHQVRVMNMMKDDPQYALLPVAAGGGKCVGFDTYVSTDSGLMQIGDLFNEYKANASATQPGFYYLNKPLKVVSTDGKFESVDMLYTRKGKIWEVRTSDGTVLRGLKEHKMYTQHGWKQLQELTANDYLLFTPNQVFNTEPAELPDVDYKQQAIDAYVGGAHHYLIDSVKACTIPTHMNTALAFILGALVAEGSHAVFCNADQKFIDKYVQAFKCCFGVDPIVKDDPRCSTLTVRAPNKAIRDFLLDLIPGDCSANQRVPKCIMRSTKEHWRAFLIALFEGDGDIAGSDVGHLKGKVHFYTISKQLQQDVFAMLKTMGIPCGVQDGRSSWISTLGDINNRQHKCYKVFVSVANLKKFQTEIGFLCDKKSQHLDTCVNTDRTSITGQNSNELAQGWYNHLPTAELVQQAIASIEDQLDPSDFRVPNGRSAYPILFKQCCTDAGYVYNVVSKGDTRYNVQQFLDIVQDPRISNTIDQQTVDIIQQIKRLADQTWCRVVDIKRNVGTEQVYDLAIDSTHAWVANGYLGHNTIVAIIDILKQYSQGKNAPYMVLCPNMLVSQYVQEVSYFTKGRLNAIPITTAVVKREGLDRLQKIFDSAPRNTVVVVSYNALVYNSHKITYGTNTVTRYPIVEFLRQFKFGYALCDESHQLKNIKSTRSKAVRILLSDIPVIRLASGTLAFNRITDLVGQAAIMDPSLFGSESDFNSKYGQFDEKGRYQGLAKGAEVLVNQAIKSDMVIAGAQRKEWAALLPQTETNYHVVHLSAEEQSIYDQVLEIATENIQEVPQLRKTLQQIEQLRAKLEVKYDEELAERIAELEDKLGSRLTPYLQRLERLIMDPYKESAFITEIPQNYVSDKAREVVKITEKHILGAKQMKDVGGVPTEEVTALPTPGKVIIFTENTDSAQSIYEAFQKLGSPVAGNGLLYSASNKYALLNKFNNDPQIKWMVGVETSINTGLNLQAASRIIRAEYPWQPGALEQGNARILRPLLKAKDGRTTVYFDWVVCEGTIDTLKVSRLMAKSAEIARFEHPTDPRYLQIGIGSDPITGKEVNQIPVIGVTMKSIKAHLDFGTEDDPGPLFDYFKAMRDLHYVEKEDYQTYRVKHPEELNPDGTLKSQAVVIEQNPKDAKLLRYIPYVEGTNLYGQAELGLVRLDEHLNRVMSEYDLDEEEESDSDKEDAKDLAYLDAIKDLKGETVWCEYGECTLYSVSASKPHCSVIPVGSSERIRVPMSSVFLITRKNIQPALLHKQLLKSVGLKELAEPDYVRPAGMKEIKRGLKKLKEVVEPEKVELEQSPEMQINIKVTVINGVLGLRFYEAEGHDLAINILEQNGFRLVPEYYRAQLRDYTMLSKWLTKMSKAGYSFKYPYDYSGAWQEIARFMKRHQSRYGSEDVYKATPQVVTRISTKSQLQNMLRWDVKPTNRTDVLRVQPMFSNGVVFAVMPSNRLYPAGNDVRRRKVPGMTWQRGPQSYEKYFTGPVDAIKCLDQLVADGLTIVNYKNALQLIKRAKLRKFDDLEKIKKRSTKQSIKKSVWDKHFEIDHDIDIVDDEIQIIQDEPLTKLPRRRSVIRRNRRA